MSAYLVWRILKFIALTLLAGGTLGAVLGSAGRLRMRALGLATCGWVGVWTAGYALMKLTGRELSQPWILWALVSSWVGLHGLALVAHRPRPRRVTYGLAVAGLLVAVAVMVTRSHGLGLNAALSAAAALVALPLSALAARPAQGDAEVDHEGSWRWFRTVARAEGASLVIMLLVSVPLRIGWGISLDAGTGLIAWIHGTLFVVYLQALGSTGRLLRWGWRRAAFGFVLALVPFGFVAFERAVARDRRASAG